MNFITNKSTSSKQKWKNDMLIVNAYKYGLSNN